MSDEVVPSPELHFEPIVNLPLVELKTLEENEEVLFQMRAKLFRYDTSTGNPGWKERGTGDVKILKHNVDDTVRILMRREKTLKICANHYIQPYMNLKPNSTSDRAWIWSTLADFADEEPKPELLAIKFANAESAKQFKAVFDKAKTVIPKSVSDDSELKESTVSSSDESEDTDADTSKDETNTSKDESNTSKDDLESSKDDTNISKTKDSDVEKEVKITKENGDHFNNDDKEQEKDVSSQLEKLSLKKDSDS